MKASSSKVGTIRRCKRKYFYTYIKELQRKVQSLAPGKGTLIHDSLATHYNGGDYTKPIQVFSDNLSKILEEVFEEEREMWMNVPQEAYRIMRGYLSAYRQIDSFVKTLATEVHFEIKLGKHVYEGYIDWIFEDATGVWVVDHKTAKKLPSEQDLYMDMQTLLYYLACTMDKNLKAMLEGKKIAGVVFNHIRTKSPAEPQVLKSGGLSKAVIDTDVATYFDTVRKHGLDVNDYADMVDKLKGNIFYRRTRIPVAKHTLSVLTEEVIDSINEMATLERKFTKTPAKTVFPRTLLKNRCAWDCDFYALCMAELAGMNTESLLSERYENRKGRDEEEGEEKEG